jgi:ribosomal-protein-alanine N-acetyltransferase
MTILETERLIFRRLVPGDLDDLFALYRDPEVRRHFPDGTLTYDQTKEELEWFVDGHPEQPRLGLWATIHKETGRFIGRCGLLPWTIEQVPEIEIAHLLDKRVWRQGFGAEAACGLVRYGFANLQLPRLIALPAPGNEASIRTARKAGLVFERDIALDGTPCSLYAIANPAARRPAAETAPS